MTKATAVTSRRCLSPPVQKLTAPFYHSPNVPLCSQCWENSEINNVVGGILTLHWAYNLCRTIARYRFYTARMYILRSKNFSRWSRQISRSELRVVRPRTSFSGQIPKHKLKLPAVDTLPFWEKKLSISLSPLLSRHLTISHYSHFRRRSYLLSFWHKR